MIPCLFCGGDARTSDHWQYCDGQQGAVEGLAISLPTREQATAARDEAMTRVEDRAETVHPSFSEEARAFVVRFLREHGPSDAEHLSVECKRSGIVPHDDRAFGPVYFHLARRGVIEKVGTAPRRRGHGTAGGNIWALAVQP